MDKLLIPAAIVFASLIVVFAFRVEVMQVGRSVMTYDRLSGDFRFCSPRPSDGKWSCREARLHEISSRSIDVSE